MTKQPIIFVAGALRSGSTLFSLMLNAHPRITNPGEFDFLFDSVSDESSWPNVAEYVAWLQTNRIFQSKSLRVDGTLKFPALIQSFVGQLQQERKVLALNVHRNFHRIPKLFPSAKYIHLIRDPRDVARSSIGMGWVGSTYYGVDHWINTEKSWDRIVADLEKQDHMEVRYEDLIDDTEGVLRKVCAFAGVDYSEQMLDYPNNSTYSAPDKSLKYQWRRKLRKQEIQFLEGKLKGWLVNRNYELSDFDPLTPGFFSLGRLYCQNKLYRAKFAIRRYGLPLYLFNMFARHFGSHSLRERCLRKTNAIDISLLK